MRSILVHVGNDEGLGHRLDAAAAIARRFEGHLTLFQPRRMPTYLGADTVGLGGGAVVVADLIAQEGRDAADTHARAERMVAGLGVPWSHEDAMGEPGSGLIDASLLQDVVIVSRGVPSEDDGRLAAAVVTRAETPVLMLPATGPGDLLGQPVAVAWKPTAEAAKAVRHAVPLLAAAPSVHVLTVDAEGDDLPVMDVMAYLSRHGIGARLHERRSGSLSAGQALGDAARELGAGLMVMGAYSRSRALQAILGGVTRTLLAEAERPLLLAR